MESVHGAFRARGSRPNVPVVHRWRAERRSSAHRPPGHTYLFCDRALGQIEANAALVRGGIWAGHITPELPKEFHHHTWEACVIGNLEKKIPPCMMNGNPHR